MEAHLQVLTTKDRVKLNFESFTVILKPLTYQERSVIEDCTKINGGQEIVDWNKTIYYTLKFAVVDIEGFKDFKDNQVKLERDGDYLSDDSISIILNCSARKDIIRSIDLLSVNPVGLFEGGIIESIKSVEMGN